MPQQPELVDAIAKMKFRRLPPQAVEAPQWLDEPTGEGWYWIEGYDIPKFVSLSDAAWHHASDRYGSNQFVLNFLRVAPCTGKPE